MNKTQNIAPAGNRFRSFVPFIIGLVLLGATIITYSNHFQNDFHFDDTHTITNNIYIRDIKNIPSFFTDMKTFGSMPDNLGYRPVVTASTAIDYWVGGGLKPFWFHFSMYLMFLVQGALMFFWFAKIFNISFKHHWNLYVAFFAAGVYLLHPGNAETINYFTSRSDSFSTLFVVMSIVIFAFSKTWGRYLLCLMPAALGVLSKESAVMLPVLLFFYVLFFEKKTSLADLFRGKKMKTAWSSLKPVMPVLLFTLLVAVIAQLIALYQTHNSGFLHTPASTAGYHFKYLITQPYVLLTYFIQFFVPVGLSSDPDITIFESAADIRMWVGFVFVIGLVIASWVASKTEKFRPVAFGFLWFLVASVPTSVLAALTQVSNSHRLFFPYVGLAIAVTWLIYLFMLKIQPVFRAAIFSRTVVAIALLILTAFAYGTWQRNEVWRNDETLWADIIQKSPGNARALMNYGLSRMGKGDFFEAEYYYRKALNIWPNWLYLHINMGILKDAQGNSEDAAQWFVNAIRLGGNSPEPYYYYARFLHEKGRSTEAISNLQTAIQLSPAHINSRTLLMGIYAELGHYDLLKDLAASTLQIVPNDPLSRQYLQMAEGKKSSLDVQKEAVDKDPTPEGYLTLSLVYYQAGQYEKCIEACEQALKLKPDFADAYNNICSAYNAMQMWDKGIEACQKALAINPDYERAKNNLKWALSEKQKALK